MVADDMIFLAWKLLPYGADSLSGAIQPAEITQLDDKIDTIFPRCVDKGCYTLPPVRDILRVKIGYDGKTDWFFFFPARNQGQLPG